jgi:hypothetical protein
VCLGWGSKRAVLAAVLVIFAQPANAARETVVLSQACSEADIQSATARQSPTSFRYDIVGPRVTRRVRACDTAGQTGAITCRMIDVHRFVLLCDGQRQHWAEVARRLDPGTFQHVRAPAGFAPLVDIGARVELGVAPARSYKLNAIVTSAPLPDITPTVELAMLPATSESLSQAFSDQASKSQSISNEPTQPAYHLGAVLFATIAAAAASALRFPAQTARLQWRLIAMTRRLQLTGRRGVAMLMPIVRHRLALLHGRPSAPMRQTIMLDVRTKNAEAAVAALLTETQALISELKNAGPLIDVLSVELAAMQHRLDTLVTTASESPDAASRASPSFRNLLRDVERVRRIADSAALSMGGTRSPTRVPQTKSEAFAALGLNPDVAEGTLKKVADGLRMSWHPDLARDETDRAEREARIKAINIALDLITGKRVAA